MDSELRQCIDLDFDFDHVRGARAGAFDCGLDRAGGGDVVVLDQHRIIEPEAVIEPSTTAHGIFLQHAQAGRRLARADNAGLGAFRSLDQRVRGSGDTREMACEIQRDAFACEDRARMTVERRKCRSCCDLRAIGHFDFEHDRRIDKAKGALCC
jgi:hypothetical protein